MSQKRSSSSNSKQFALWQIGLLLIIVGPLAYTLLEIVWPLKPPLTNEQQGQAVGRGLASILAIIAGVVMVVLHFVRRKRN